MVFPRDEEIGKKLCHVLEGGYSPLLYIYKKDIVQKIAEEHDMLLGVMAVGILVRLTCPLLHDKWEDMPVVAVNFGTKCVIPIVGGHHGANKLAIYLSQKLGFYPAITTATESMGRLNLEEISERLGTPLVNTQSSKDVNLAFLSEDVPIIRLKGPKVVIVDDDVAVLRKKGGIVVGIGCRRGVSATEIVKAVNLALKDVGRKIDEVSLLASADLKRDEPGMRTASKELGKEIIFLTPEVLNAQIPTTPSRASDIGLVGVAEPCVLALANRLIMQKKAFGRVTIALGE